MKKEACPTPSPDIDSLNESILDIDLDAVAVEVLDQRLELALATLFGETGIDTTQAPCGQFTCTGYMPGG